MRIFISLALIFFISPCAQSAELWKSEKPIANFHLKAKYQSNRDGTISISAAPGATVSFSVKQGSEGIIEIGASQKEGERGRIKGWMNGKPLSEFKEYGEAGKATKTNIEGKSLFVSSPQQSKDPFDLGKDFTAYVRFKTKGDGTLFSKAVPGEKWLKNGKALYIREGRLIYDIGWKGMITGAKKIDDGKWHEAALVTRSGKASLYLDGKRISENNSFSANDPAKALFQIGACTADFGGDFEGTISNLRYWKRGLDEKESLLAVSNRVAETNTPDFNWLPTNSERPGKKIQEGKPSVIDGFVAWQTSITADNDQIKISEVNVSEIGDADHSQIVNAWDHNSLDRGARIYNGLCITCHGTDKVEGTLPTALRFHKGEFKNGKDPLSMYTTLTKGFNQMVAQPWMTPQQKWDVIHYIRETFIKTKNPSQFVDVDEAYLNSLPRGLDLGPQSPKLFGSGEPKWKKMDYGPVQFWTIQVGSGNIAYKGIAVRLDEGPGGIAQGNKWILYDHDTMRVASAWEGKGYIDWRGIAFDQSHGSHASLVGKKVFENPVGPGVGKPSDGTFKDPRFLGRDGKPYGPLPREWTHYKGTYLHGGRAIIKYTIGNTEVHELPGYETLGEKTIFTRTLEIGKSEDPIRLRIAPNDKAVATIGAKGATIKADPSGLKVLEVPAAMTPARIKILIAAVEQKSLDEHLANSGPPIALSPLTQGSSKRWPTMVTTEGKNGGSSASFEVDEVTLPLNNPWNSWMRVGGFDFFEDGKRAAVATWLGDVFIVDGIDKKFGEHKWQRIATGLFQPLGVRIVKGKIFVTCRDQIAKLHDLNNDNEIDYIESFNNDHQVTEHFHEFAMGLQTDESGNFYYAKSARHAKTALVPHHGTLIKVSSDGAKSKIIANGFRAANGVCLNPDGTFIVTDQEGHWNPKNRINYVKEGGFYGNMFGYHDVTDNSDSAMEQPLCWITNNFDRSPGELMWVPENAGWGSLNGKLLNLSYGTGKIFLVPHEKIGGQAQGGMISLGLDFPTGIMRGRFHPENGQLYATGMFAWAGSKRGDGGFYRIRYTGKTPKLPAHLIATKDGIEIEFTTKLDQAKAQNTGSYQIEVWDLKRTRNYGSKHYNQRKLTVKKAVLSSDKKRIRLLIPDLKPTWGMAIRYNLSNAEGEKFNGEIHNSIHRMPES